MALDERAVDLLSKGWYKERLTEDDCAYLLSFRSGSPVANLTVSLAERIEREQSVGVGRIEARIPVSVGPCSGCCSFCRLGEGVYDGGFDDMDGDALAACCEELGTYKDVRTIRLATTADASIESLCQTVETAKAFARKGTLISLETRDLSSDEIRELKAAGMTEAYCSCRIGEGVDTPYSPESRLTTMRNLAKEGIAVVAASGPFGPEHTPEQIAAEFYRTLDVGAPCADVYARVPVPCTPYADKGELVPKRMTQMRAVFTLCSGRHESKVRHPCPGPYVRGRNVAVAEFGGQKRSEQISAARRRLFNAGYGRIMRCDGTSLELSLSYLMQTGSVRSVVPVDVVTAGELKLGGGVDLVQALPGLGGDLPHLAEHPGVLHGAEELHPDDALRVGVLVQEVGVEGVRVVVPVDYPVGLLLGEGVGLRQEVHHRHVQPELDQRRQGHGGHEAVGAAVEGGVGQVGEHGRLLGDAAGDHVGGLPEREELQLPGRVYEGVVGVVVAPEGVLDLADVHRHEVRGDDLRPVGTQAELGHDLVEADPLPDVDVGVVRDPLRSGVEVDDHGVDLRVVEPVLEGADHGALAAPRGPDEVHAVHGFPIARRPI